MYVCRCALQAQRQVQRLPLEPGMLEFLARHNLSTARDVLSHSTLDLMELTGATHAQARALLEAVSLHVTPPYVAVRPGRCGHGAGPE